MMNVLVAQAGPIPSSDTMVDLNVREQAVGEFIEALFREIEVPVIVAEQIEGTVNGRFDGTVQGVFDEVSSAFNVMVYFDGTVAYIYPSNQLSRAVLGLDAVKAQRVISTVKQMGLPDAKNQLSKAGGGLLVSGTPRFAEQVQEVVEAIRATASSTPSVPSVARRSAAAVQEEDPQLMYRVFRLNHAWAQDTSFSVGGQQVVVPGVATILKDLISSGAAGYGLAEGGGAGARSGSNTLSGLRGQGLVGSASSGQEQEGVLVGASGNAESNRIVADTRLNAVIIRDTQQSMGAYASLIQSLDTASEMVEIEATIIDVNTDKSRELGVNWRYQTQETDVLFGSGTASDQALLAGSGLITPQGRGGVLSLMLGEPADFLARINLLERQGAARIVSKPHVITLSDVEAVLGATTEFFVRVAGDEQVDLFNVPVGTVLRVTPHVFTESGVNRIKLLVNIEDGSQSPNQTVDQIPVVERASISTQALINEGDSLLIGGLVRDSYRRSDYRVPVLGSVPLLGRLFRSEGGSTSRVERLFLITPRLAKGAGFGQRKGLPMLQGEANQIVADSEQRMEAMAWPARSERAYWPEHRSSAGADTSLAELSLPEGGQVHSSSLEPADNARTPRRQWSRFTVQPWLVNGRVSP